ncbi:hypothetical protein ANOM_007271 [Aspergillus nomiae NRRL 13137]|uniref:T6SS Phospholipase effector Tle1-like catalytic domain-containing protein n=1 Tax=Aspergillus nomiae NRRL (strain ATCC 15546 / NRRL 13137 / CBS 260.88 / M93) TaxID=1509407 RepID=A0A0L1IXK3_ASPN3|nr:uncharacterized protein ANOM_007271 [Aspergillus nomiae NRRL 13137]KNG84227.1 hypothetical protein ANOM_007271 [Aspergillus nomiae NRRL 13137]
MSCPEHRKRAERVIVLCFDGTSNTFQADGTETGVGTEISPTSLSSNPLRRRSKLFSSKLVDSALAVSFDQHVLGGYRFLMRHYRAGSQIYIFGFSRGAYTARFLNEMLDHAGLLSADNEEMIPFIWEAFSSYKLTVGATNSLERKETEKALNFLKACRETVCREVDRVHFLGLFDTVNSTAEFQVNAEVKPNSEIIRHALSIDERRVKFYPVLIEPKKEYQFKPHRRLWPWGHRGSRTCGGDSDSGKQDIQEVWFPGCHADVGGGWDFAKDEDWRLSHGPLVWMVYEAQQAGLHFDKEKLDKLMNSERQGKAGSVTGDSEKLARDSPGDLVKSLHLSSTKGVLHDNLQPGEGISSKSTRFWFIMEHIPFRRMVLQLDGSWKATRWPLHRGRSRDVPKYAQIHVSAIERMKADTAYRPMNIILEGPADRKGKVCAQFEIEEWKVWCHKGDRVREAYVRGKPSV